MNAPQLPPGFELDAAPPPLPPGFEPDGPGPAAPARVAPQQHSVGLLDSIARTLGMSAQAPMRMLNLAVGTNLARAADAVHNLFTGRDDNFYTDAALSASDEQQRGMSDIYAPKQDEKFNRAGSVIGGVLSAPNEITGGFGLQHGIERATEVLDRGGSGADAAKAGAVSAGVHAGLNMLPMKVGGAVGKAMESTLGGVASGAITGGTVAGVGGAVGREAENAALPDDNRFEDLKAPTGIDPTEVGMGALFGAVPGAHAAGSAALKEAKAKAAKLAAPENEGIANAIDAGYKLTPKAGKAGVAPRTLQTAAGSARLEQSLSARNSENTARLARADIGLPDDVPLTREATADVRKEAGADYAAVADAGRIDFDEQYSKDLSRIVEPYIEGGKDFDALAKNPIINAIEGLKKDGADAASVIEIVKDLRDKADAQFGPGGSKKLGMDYRAAAETVDNAMDRALNRKAEATGDPSLADAVDKYRAARVRIAKTYLADDAMSGKPGEINALTYGRALRKGVKLSGPAKQIAEFANQFGDEGLAKKAGKSGHIGPTYHDIVLAALHTPTALVGVAARPLTRAALGSEWMQRRMAAKARAALPEETAPPAPPAEPTLGQGFDPVPQDGAPTSSLGDLTPDWETAPDAATGAAMQTPEAQLAMRGQQTGRNVAAATAETPRSIPVGEATEIKPQTVEPAGAPKFKEPPVEKLPTGEATEIKPEVVKPAEAPKTDARLAEVERLKASTDSSVVRKALDERAEKIKKELKADADAEQRRGDSAELRRTAALTADPEIKADLFAKAKAIEKADAIPAPKVVEGQPEIKTETPKSIPAGKAKEIAPPSNGETLADLDLPKLDEAYMHEQQRAQRASEPTPSPEAIERGRRQVRAALEKGAADGSLGKDEAGLALWALDKNPNLARGLRIETPKGAEGDIAKGVYVTAERVIKLFQEKSDPERAAHEILHHSERMMPPEVQRGIRREWRAALDTAIGKADPTTADALRSIAEGITGGKEAFEAMKTAFADGTLSRTEHYHLTNPSEFWAVNATRLLRERHAGRNSWRLAAVRWLKDMIEHTKGSVGLRSDSPVIRALNGVLDPVATKGSDRSTSTLKTAEAKAMLASAADVPAVTHALIDVKTGKEVGQYKNEKEAEQRKAKLDASYGADRYEVRQLTSSREKPTKRR